mmetsp:Transcript_20025/g.49061  ORF Transcript_20025/g.49061 Transcript_20025/m.49061 type:complete len:431 (+) Transcript_20025:231-1523(+)
MGAALSGAARNAGLQGVEGLVLGRACLRLSFTLVHLSLDHHLIDKVAKGDPVEAQRLSALMSTVNSIVSFALRSAAGAALDAWGRKPFLVCCPIFAAVARLCFVARPSRRAYMLYRLLINLSWMPLWPAITAYMADKLGRGSARYSVAVQRTRLVLTAVGLVALRIGARVRSARRNIFLSCIANLVASLVFLTCVSETLPEKKRVGLALSRAGNPLSFLTTLSKSPRLKALCPLLILQAIPDYDYTSKAYYRKQFGWKVTENANMMFFNQISGIVEGWICPEKPIIQALGVKATTQLASLLGAMQDLNAAFTSRPDTIYFNALLWPFMHGRTAVSTIVAKEAERLDIGHGELSSALENLTFPLRFMLPALFSELFAKYQKRLPQINLILKAAVRLLLAGIVLPSSWTCLKPLADQVDVEYSQDAEAKKSS